MSFLERISLIRRLTNGQDYDYIGSSGKKEIYHFDEKNSRFAIIANVELAKKVLSSNNIEAINHLSSFIREEDKKDLYYILLFLHLSPEFSTTFEHNNKSNRTKKILKRFIAACQKVEVLTLANNVKQKIDKLNTFSTLKLANIYLSEYLTMAGKIYFMNDNFIFSEEHITEKYGFFNAIPRIARLKAFNSDIEEHISNCKLINIEEDDIFLILLLRIMGSAPLSGTITAQFNDLVDKISTYGNLNTDPDLLFLQKNLYFNSFLPTRFVLRRVSADTIIQSFEFQEDDILFVYLATTEGCPLRQLKNIPFGFGAHACPGRKISELILKTIFRALDNELLKKASTTRQNIDNTGAFLSFEKK